MIGFLCCFLVAASQAGPAAASSAVASLAPTTGAAATFEPTATPATVIVPPPAAECLEDTAVRAGRWRVESVREGEPPAEGIADIVRWQGGCVLLERLLIHFDDGSSHAVVFVQGVGTAGGRPRLLQVADHPLFLVWRREQEGDGDVEGEAYVTTRVTDRGPIELRWRTRSSGDGFERELSVRRPGESRWTPSERILYTPLPAVTDLDAVPPRRPGPFHEPDACAGPEFRQMDDLLGHWFNEEWVREGDGWTPGTVSDVSVRSIIGGCALLEEHPMYDTGRISDRLLLLRGYDPARGHWRQLVFGHGGGVWEWAIEATGDEWLLTPVGGEMEGRLRIHERYDATGVHKKIQVRADGHWETRRRIRYVRW